MPRFLVTYHGGEMPSDPQARASAREEFTQWAAKTGSALVEPGAPVKSAVTVSAGGTHAGRAEGPFTGWSVIEAADADAAARLLDGHPFLGRGGVLQVSEPAQP